jgi:hypothetical protein
MHYLLQIKALSAVLGIRPDMDATVRKSLLQGLLIDSTSHTTDSATGNPLGSTAFLTALAAAFDPGSYDSVAGKLTAPQGKPVQVKATLEQISIMSFKVGVECNNGMSDNLQAKLPACPPTLKCMHAINTCAQVRIWAVKEVNPPDEKAPENGQCHWPLMQQEFARIKE